PYTVPGDPIDPSKEKKDEPRKPLPPFSRSWDTGYPLSSRLRLFGLLLVANVVALYSGWNSVSLGTLLSMLAGTTVLQAFLIGTFDRIELERNFMGKIRLTRRWRVAFNPLPAVEPIRWSEFESLAVRRAHEPRFEDWIVLLILIPYVYVPIRAVLAGAADWSNFVVSL